MKKIAKLLVLFLAFYLPVQSQTESVTQLGTIGVSCSEYTNSVNKTWNINIATNKKLKLDYSLNLENVYDKIQVYSIDASGNASWQETLTGSKAGSILSLYANGKMRLIFTTDGSVCCSTHPNSYTGFQITISEEKPLQSFVDATFSGEVGIGLSPQVTSKLFLNNTTNNSADIYGLRVNIANTDGVGNVYGIHSKASTTNGGKSYSAYFEGSMELSKGDFIIGGPNKRFLMQTCFGYPETDRSCCSLKTMVLGTLINNWKLG